MDAIRRSHGNNKTMIQLIREITEQFNLSDVAVFGNKYHNLIPINVPGFSVFPFTHINEALESLDSIQNTDFIFADPPLGQKKTIRVKDVKSSKSNFFIYSSLPKLSQNGLGLFMVEPGFFFKSNIPFIELLSSESYFVKAVFLTPEETLSATSLRPYLVLIGKKKSDRYFVCELTEESDLHEIIHNLRTNTETTNIYTGMFTPAESFTDFQSFKIILQIESLQTQYKEFESHSLGRLALEVNLHGKQGFEDKPNSIYIPTVGTSPPQIRVEDFKIKPFNYIQLVLDDSKVLNKYLQIFFKSKLGKLVLESIKSGNIIRKINKSKIPHAFVPVPRLETQEFLIESFTESSEKLEKLQSKLAELTDEISLNPKSASFIKEKLIPVLDHLDMLSEEEKILETIRKGEDKYTEFKQTLRKNIKTGQKDKNIENSALKEIIAFLNTEGGILIIGVTDEGEITGINKDIYQSDDKYKLHFYNLVRDRIGVDAFEYLDYKVLKVQDKNLFLVHCRKSDKPFFLEGKEFYYRINPSAQKLEGKELIEYIKRRFPETKGS